MYMLHVTCIKLHAKLLEFFYAKKWMIKILAYTGYRQKRTKVRLPPKLEVFDAKPFLKPKKTLKNTASSGIFRLFE